MGYGGEGRVRGEGVKLLAIFKLTIFRKGRCQFLSKSIDIYKSIKFECIH